MASTVVETATGFANKLIDFMVEQYQTNAERRAFMKQTRNNLERIFRKHHVLIYVDENGSRPVNSTLNNGLVFSNRLVGGKNVVIEVFVHGFAEIRPSASKKNYYYSTAATLTKPSLFSRVKRVFSSKRELIRIDFAQRDATFIYTDPELDVIHENMKKIELKVLTEHDAQKMPF